jgi:hypothetical protein
MTAHSKREEFPMHARLLVLTALAIVSAPVAASASTYCAVQCVIRSGTSPVVGYGDTQSQATQEARADCEAMSQHSHGAFISDCEYDSSGTAYRTACNCYLRTATNIGGWGDSESEARYNAELACHAVDDYDHIHSEVVSCQ